MSTLTVSTITNLVAQVAFFARQTPPSGWLEADGSAVSRATYAALFAEIGETYGAGDSSTTFNLPDLRGEFVRGWDNAKGTDTGRAFGSAQLDQMQKITGRFAGVGGVSVSAQDQGAFTDAGTFASNRDSNTLENRRVAFDSSNSPNARVSATTAGETRARNIALLACIKF